jgi:hypothetical protein
LAGSRYALALVAELASLLLLDGPLQVAASLWTTWRPISPCMAWRPLCRPGWPGPCCRRSTVRPRVPAYALLYCFAFFIPVLGVLATVLAVQIAQRFPKILRTERFVAVHMPEFSGVQREPPSAATCAPPTRGAS